MFAARTGSCGRPRTPPKSRMTVVTGGFKSALSVTHGAAADQGNGRRSASGRLYGPPGREYIPPVSRCQCEGIESVFDQGLAAAQLERVHRKGPLKTTRLLIEAIRACGVKDRTLLDIGAGVGIVHHELLASGAADATDVDASSAYVQAAESEARRRGLNGRARYLHGNFLDLADRVPPADIVTLDRVICCFDDMQGLVAASAEKARLLYGIVYPRDAWWARLGILLLNFSRRVRGDQFRVFAYKTAAVESVLRSRGLARKYYREAGLWQVAVFSREADAAGKGNS